MKYERKYHFPLPILIGEGKLILDAATAHPEVSTRLDPNYLTDTAASLSSLKTQSTDQKQKRGQTGVLSKAQLDKIHFLQKEMSDARESAKLAFSGQAVKLREQFQVGVHKPHDVQSQLQRARIILAGLQAAENAPVLASKGWIAADTTALNGAITDIESDKTLLENSKDAGIGSTGVKNTEADDMYDRLLTIQNAANRQWPDSDPANAQTRADFRFGKFPPKDHGGQHVEPTPAPAVQTSTTVTQPLGKASA
ncbi:MAG TPA: hypothetical protein VMB22_05475 [Verrucomicrobiae bacterium]|nr:hypothetical protein [Verrucomicrobiae bacterium]